MYFFSVSSNAVTRISSITSRLLLISVGADRWRGKSCLDLKNERSYFVSADRFAYMEFEVGRKQYRYASSVEVTRKNFACFNLSGRSAVVTGLPSLMSAEPIV